MSTFFSNRSNSSFGNETYSSYSFPAMSLPPVIRFWLLLVFLIPSLICSFILLYHLIFDRNLRKVLSNHVIIALLFNGLFIQLVGIPLNLNYYRTGSNYPPVPIMCLLKWFNDLAMFSLRCFLMAWASIEQHILVFHEQLVGTKLKRIFIHYLPLTTIILYCIILFSFVVFFPTCQHNYIYSQEWCSTPCYFSVTRFSMYSNIFNSFLPTLLTFTFTISLYVRVIKQKQRLRQRLNWRKCRKMFVQFLMISFVFLVFDIPAAAFSLTGFWRQSYITIQLSLYTYFIRTMVSLFMPFVFLASVPEAYKKIKKTFDVFDTSVTAVAQRNEQARTIQMAPVQN